MSTIRNLKNQESFPFSLKFRNYWISTMGNIPPNLDQKYLVRLEISKNLDTPRKVVLVLVFVNSGKCCSIRKLKSLNFLEIQTRIFLQMESAFLIVFLTVSMNAFHSTNLFCCFSRYQAPANSVAPPSVYKPHTTHNSSIRSDEGLTLETSTFESLYGGQFTLSTQLIKPNYLIST